MLGGLRGFGVEDQVMPVQEHRARRDQAFAGMKDQGIHGLADLEGIEEFLAVVPVQDGEELVAVDRRGELVSAELGRELDGAIRAKGIAAGQEQLALGEGLMGFVGAAAEGGIAGDEAPDVDAGTRQGWRSPSRW